MITYTTGDILKSDAEALVNTVNCVGIMGRGIALKFKGAYPANFKVYKRACDQGLVRPGTMLVYETLSLTNPKFIINFPTKRHWKGKSQIEDIEAGLVALVSEIQNRSIKSIAIPPLGAGLGGLYWPDVRQRIVEAMASLQDVSVIVYEPIDVPASYVAPKVPKMTLGRATLVALVHRYLSGLLDPYASLLEIQKLMYFIQVAGEPLRLRYEKGPYGPYADNLRHVLRDMEGHLISGFADGGEAPEKPIELVPLAIDEAERYIEGNQDTIDRLERVKSLVEGYETPYGLELLSTVHWVAAREQAHSIEQIVDGVHSWNQRKQKFTPRQMQLALARLQSEHWLAA